MRPPDYIRPSAASTFRRRPHPDYLNMSLALGVLSFAAYAVGTRLYEFQQGPQPTAAKQEQTMFLERIENKLSIAIRPQPVMVEFSAIQGYNNQKVVFRRNPSVDSADTVDLYPADIKTRFAARILGDWYPTGTTTFQIAVPYGDKERKGGLWFAPCNEYGQFINPVTGAVLEPTENPFYTVANFVTVVKPQPLLAKTQPSEEALFPQQEQGGR